MTSRDELTASIADRLANGDDVGKRSLFDVLATQAEWCSLDDFITLATGSLEQVLNVQDRLRAYHTDLCAAWLDTPQGSALVDAELERAGEDEAEDVRSAA